MQKINRCMKCMWEKEKGRFCRNCGYDSGSQNPERALPVGTILHNKYMIGAVLGEGGFGITYAAWDTLIETPIAIKEYFPSEAATRDTTMHDGELHTDLTLIQGEEGEQCFQTGIERFVQEAEKLARFQKQPGVVCVKDFFYANNTAYMVMEYIRGTTLKTYLDSHGDKLSVEETLKMMEPVMRTLEEIHRAGVIHRDISPDNIMVTEDGQIKLIDFGAAKFMDAGDEKSMTLMLKHGYAPEEQYRSDGKQGAWTDVYALSAVMYRMLTGKAPEEITRRMVERPDAVHKELAAVPGLSVQVRHGIEKGLAMKADKRYQTIGALYNGIYGRRKMQTGQWVIAGGIVAAAVVCMVFGGMIVRKTYQDKGKKDVSAQAEDVRETLETDTLISEENEGKKETETEVQMGKDKAIAEEEKAESKELQELKTFSEEELTALVEENSGKYIGNIHVYEEEGETLKRTSCYDDFDGDGRYELFAYVAAKWEQTDYGECGEMCAIWFSDGEQTVWITDIENGWYTDSIDVIQFGKNKHFSVRRHLGVGSAGYHTTTCALDEGIPHSVIEERNVYLLSVNGRTHCRIGEFNQYDAYGSNRYYEDYSIFYKDGEYWEYASKNISKEELWKYENGKDILDQVVEKGKSFYVGLQGNGFDYDYSQYPYIEIESILLNSENEEIIVNMRHWKSSEQADYFKHIAEDELSMQLISIDGAASYPSETRLSVQDNILQIEEMKFGHKAVNGTEFRPLYPD